MRPIARTAIRSACALAVTGTAFAQSPPPTDVREVVTVTGSRVPRTLSDLPLSISISIVDGEDVREQLGISTNILGVLDNTVPGLTVSQGEFRSGCRTHIRGRPAQFLINGVPTNDDLRRSRLGQHDFYVGGAFQDYGVRRNPDGGIVPGAEFRARSFNASIGTAVGPGSLRFTALYNHEDPTRVWGTDFTAVSGERFADNVLVATPPNPFEHEARTEQRVLSLAYEVPGVLGHDLAISIYNHDENLVQRAADRRGGMGRQPGNPRLWADGAGRAPLARRPRARGRVHRRMDFRHGRDPRRVDALHLEAAGARGQRS